MSVLLLSSLLLFGVDTASSAGKLSVASSLIDAIAQERLTENIIFSPANIQHSLVLLYLGAKGTTAAQLQASLKLDKSKEKVVKKFSTIFDKKLANKKINFKIATRLYLAEDLKIAKSFEGYAKSFNAQVMNMKFEVSDYRKLINEWLDQQTSDKIPNLITDHMEALLVNSIYFKAKWRHTFSKPRSDGRGTKQEILRKKVLMALEDTILFKEFDNLGANVVQLKLKDTKFSMLFIQPKADSGGLPALVSKLKEVDLTQLPKAMQKTNVTLMVPKFTIEFDTSLKSELHKLGMKSLFNKKHFNNIVAGNKSLAFSDFRHKSYIQVDEKGIEMASVTGTNPYSPPEKVDYVAAQQPLFFALIGKNSVYFAGHVAHF